MAAGTSTTYLCSAVEGSARLCGSFCPALSSFARSGTHSGRMGPHHDHRVRDYGGEQFVQLHDSVGAPGGQSERAVWRVGPSHIGHFLTHATLPAPLAALFGPAGRGTGRSDWHHQSLSPRELLPVRGLEPVLQRIFHEGLEQQRGDGDRPQVVGHRPAAPPGPSYGRGSNIAESSANGVSIRIWGRERYL